MPAGEFQGWMARQHPQQWHADLLEHITEKLLVPWRGNAVEHNPSNGQVGVVIAKAPHQGRQGCGLAAGFHHQQHRQTKAGGHSSAAAIGAGTHAIE